MQILSSFTLIVLILFYTLKATAQVNTTYIKNHELPFAVKITAGQNQIILTETVHANDSEGKDVKKKYHDNQPINIGINVSTRDRKSVV